MVNVFNAAEILEVAVNIERTGAAFYRRAAEIVSDPASRKLLEELAEMEVSHETSFESMRDDPRIFPQTLGDPDSPVKEYLKILAGGHIFNEAENPAAILKAGISEAEVLMKALSLEMESITYYQGIREVMPKELGKRKVGDIIHEEMSHVIVLSERLAALKTDCPG